MRNPSNRRCARLKNHLVEPICPIHKCEKNRKGKHSLKDGTKLYFCALCCRVRESEVRDAGRFDPLEEDMAFRKIDAYLQEQAEILALRRRFRAYSPQCALGYHAC